MLPKKPSPKSPPSFTANKQDDAKKPPIPVWGSGGKDKVTGMPMFRSPGFAGAGTLAGRFKNLKTKDLAFITAGLAVLVMAPLAEYLISAPEDNSGTLRQGFDQKGGLFPDGASPYENGVAGIAPGGLMGQDSDVITPLNVRDPSSLIMSPGGRREAPKAEPAASPVPPKKRSGWKDAIAAAKAGARKAVSKAPKLPRPSGKLQGALKDWRSTVSGASRGGGPTARLDAPTSKGLFSAPRTGSSLARTQGLPGLSGGARGVAAGGSGPGVYGGGRYGDAGASGAGAAASTFGPGGLAGGGYGPGGGRPSFDGAGKGPGANSHKDNRSLGESLAFLRAKKEMEKAIDLKWAKKRYDELERKKMIEQTALQTAQQAFLKVLDKLLEKPKDGGGGGGSGGGGPSGGKPDGQGTPQGRTQTSAPASVPQTLPETQPAETADNAKKGEEIGRAAVEQANSQLGGLTSEYLAKLESDMGDVSRDANLSKIKGALGSAKSAVDAAKRKLGEEHEKLSPTARMQKVAELNGKIEENLPKIQEGVQAERDVAAKGKEVIGNLKVETSGDEKKYEGNGNTDAVEAAKTKVEAIQSRPVHADLGGGAQANPNVAEQMAQLRQANADIGSAYAAIADSPLAAQMQGLAEMKQRALQAIDTAGQNITQVQSAVTQEAKALNQAEQLTTQAGTAHDAIDLEYSGELQRQATHTAEEVVRLDESWTGVYQRQVDGTWTDVKPAPFNNKSSVEGTVTTLESALPGLNEKLQEARQRFNGGA